jgi:hypothetical protein
MTTAFAPIDLSTVAEPADLTDILTEHPHTPEFNKVVAEFAATIEGLRVQQWPIVASDDEPEAPEEAEGTQEAEEPESPEQPEETPAPTPVEEAPAEEPEVTPSAAEAAE